MIPYSFGGNELWNTENLFLGAAFFDWHRDFSNLPEEVKSYLSEHENEIHSEADVDTLVRAYNLKK